MVVLHITPGTSVSVPRYLTACGHPITKHTSMLGAAAQRLTQGDLIMTTGIHVRTRTYLFSRRDEVEQKRPGQPLPPCGPDSHNLNRCRIMNATLSDSLTNIPTGAASSLLSYSDMQGRVHCLVANTPRKACESHNGTQVRWTVSKRTLDRVPNANKSGHIHGKQMNRCWFCFVFAVVQDLDVHTTHIARRAASPSVYAFFAASFARSSASYSFSCLDQLHTLAFLSTTKPARPGLSPLVEKKLQRSSGRGKVKLHVLSARVPAPGLGPARPRLPLGAKVPRHGHNRRHDGARDDGVALPVGRLRVPTTGRRPDVLGVPIFRRALFVRTNRVARGEPWSVGRSVARGLTGSFHHHPAHLLATKR
jgi:hypothetical protein